MITAQEPLALFFSWYAEAKATEPRVPDAVQIATVDHQGQPWVRTVLMKELDARGLVFYTNLGSRKARQLSENSAVAGCFHWKGLERQVLFRGVATKVEDQEADAYFATRIRGSQIGAWASRQSEVVDDPGALAEIVTTLESRFGEDPIPRPPFWSGYRVEIAQWEFWQGQPDRLHDRLEFCREPQGWSRRWLQP